MLVMGPRYGLESAMIDLAMLPKFAEQQSPLAPVGKTMTTGVNFSIKTLHR